MKRKYKTTILILFNMAISIVATIVIFIIDTYMCYKHFSLYRPEVTVAQRVINYAILLILFIGVFTADTFLVYMVYKHWIIPVKRLNNAIERVYEGELDFEVKAEGNDEISIMINNFDNMRKRLKESEEEKNRAFREQQEMISNISHDLKTPITSIRGYVEGIMDGVADTPEKRDKYLKTIYNKTNDLNYLINGLNIYSNLDINKDTSYNFHLINVREYFRDCADELEIDLGVEGIEFEYKNNVPEDTMVVADPEQLKLAVGNIVGNSVKYMDKAEGKVSLCVSDMEESVKVELSDNGAGIADENLTNIFERFFRADTARSLSKPGNGIGLAIVKQIVEKHGGYVWATSKLGIGTTIHFVIKKYLE
ncbi:MAG: HAMP domain-containing histidine kinase [Lachnospiraceae bacterium]|nr:HAMP domain-containing histidine kinase [Lachnospiraceae bacterium]